MSILLRSASTGNLISGHFRHDIRYETIRPHGTNDWLLIYTVRGAGNFPAIDGEFTAPKGTLILLKPGMPHHYRTDPQFRYWELLWAHFLPRAEWLPWLNGPQSRSHVGTLRFESRRDQKQIEQDLHAVCRLTRGPSRWAETWAMNALERVILRCHERNPQQKSAPLDERVLTAMEYLCDHLQQPFHAETLSRHCGVSSSRLSHLFVAQTGSTPRDYHELQRVRRARELLEKTQQPISQISEEVGFQSAFYFSLRFKKWIKKSPRAYRNSLNPSLS